MPPDTEPTDEPRPAAKPRQPWSLYPSDLGATIGRIAGHLDSEHARGEAATLRRLDDGLSPAFYRFFEKHELERWRPTDDRDESERIWGVVLQALAAMAGLHAYDRSLGAALADAGVSELRFMQLCRAEGSALHALVRRVARRLASARVSFNHAELAWLVLSDFETRGGASRDRTRRALARSFFNSVSHTNEAD